MLTCRLARTVDVEREPLLSDAPEERPCSLETRLIGQLPRRRGAANPSVQRTMVAALTVRPHILPASDFDCLVVRVHIGVADRHSNRGEEHGKALMPRAGAQLLSDVMT